MDRTLLIYLVFGGVLLIALVFDLGLLSKKNTVVSTRSALIQTIFWVLLSVAFCGFIYFEKGSNDSISYLSAYLLEWSLSIDNIFIFVIIFTFFNVKQHHYSRVLLMGILMAILFRILFIAIGSALVARFEWVMYVFGGLLLYTGIRVLRSNEKEEFNPEKNWAYRFMQKFMRTTNEEPNGKFIIIKNKKAYFTRLAMVVVMLGLIDLVFALDSIPAVFSIIPDPSKKLLIYSSNIFAVLGLRSIFFLLRNAAKKFHFLQHGIAIVLVFIGLKMLLAKWMYIPIWASLLVIVVCIGTSMAYSVYDKRR